MGNQDKQEGTMTVIDAVETLSQIADFEFELPLLLREEKAQIGEEKSTLIPRVKKHYREGQPIDIDIIKNAFKVIHNYLRSCVKKDVRILEDGKNVEGIKTIMVLVGEAARKLDRFTDLFHRSKIKSVTELKEYKKLQEMYLKNIDSKEKGRVDEKMLGKWITAISNQKPTLDGVDLIAKRGYLTRHVYVDLDSVKRDMDHELFFIRKEDGSRFFSPRLIRNLKLVNDFKGAMIGDYVLDPLEKISFWCDSFINDCARNIIKACRKHIQHFYKEGTHFKEKAIVTLLHDALMALMLAANTHNKMTLDRQMKNCRGYFKDFILFMRQLAKSRDFHHLITYPPPRSNRPAISVLETSHALCIAVFSQMTHYQSVLPMVEEFLSLAAEGNVNHSHDDLKTLHGWLIHDYKLMTSLLKLHPNGAINKVLETLEEGIYQGYDPLLQENYPSNLFSLYVQDYKCRFSRLPAPVHQEFVNQAEILDEFKAFLRGCEHESHMKKCLVFNFEDRVSWRGQLRSSILEELQNKESFAKYIDILTLPKDTEFYHQMAPYNRENEAEAFIRSFIAQIKDNSCGFLFPEKMQKEIFNRFAEQVIRGVHRIFFGARNMLLKESRMDFIEIVYLFLQLKGIELSRPDMAMFSCKDGLDISLSSGAQLFVFLKLLNQERLSEMDRDQLDLMLYGPCLLTRERLMNQERFRRFVSTVRTIETTRSHFGFKDFKKIIQEAFGMLYLTPILHGKCILQDTVEEL